MFIFNVDFRRLYIYIYNYIISWASTDIGALDMIINCIMLHLYFFVSVSGGLHASFELVSLHRYPIVIPKWSSYLLFGLI